MNSNANTAQMIEKIAASLDLQEWTTDELSSVIAQAVTQGRVYLLRDITDELMQRAKSNSVMFSRSQAAQLDERA